MKPSSVAAPSTSVDVAANCRAARAYSGFDTFTSTETLAAGSDVRFTGQVVVPGNGAAYATQREIDCQAQKQS